MAQVPSRLSPFFTNHFLNTHIVPGNDCSVNFKRNLTQTHFYSEGLPNGLVFFCGFFLLQCSGKMSQVSPQPQFPSSVDGAPLTGLPQGRGRLYVLKPFYEVSDVAQCPKFIIDVKYLS